MTTQATQSKSVIAGACLVFICSLPSPSYAAIYKQKQPDGTVIYTDQPAEGLSHEKIDVPPTAIIPSVDTRGLNQPSKKKSRTVEYAISISSPSNETHYHNEKADAIPLNISVNPNPQYGSTVSVTVDGRQIGSNASVLPMMYRGEHTITVKVLSRSGKTLASTSNTFYVHRFSAGQ